MKKQWVLFLGIAGSILGSVWLVRQVSQKPAPEPVTITLADESARIAFLQEHGFPDGVCIAAECVQLPAEEMRSTMPTLLSSGRRGCRWTNAAAKAPHATPMHKQPRTGNPACGAALS